MYLLNVGKSDIFCYFYLFAYVLWKTKVPTFIYQSEPKGCEHRKTLFLVPAQNSIFSSCPFRWPLVIPYLATRTSQTSGFLNHAGLFNLPDLGPDFSYFSNFWGFRIFRTFQTSRTSQNFRNYWSSWKNWIERGIEWLHTYSFYLVFLERKISFVEALAIMPCPFTSPKMFCTDPNVLSHSKNLIAFSAPSKTFVPAQKPILQNANHLLVWHKMFVAGTICK